MANNSFKDSTGREWSIRLTIGAALDVYDETGVDLLNPLAAAEGGGLSAVDSLIASPALLAEVVYFCCRARTTDKKNFLDHLDGAAFKRASDAFWGEYERFFVASGRATIARAITRKQGETAARATIAETVVRELRRACSLS